MRESPNENYSRELMELFTLGANRGAYTETDVREQARALTGWSGSVNNGSHAVRLRPEPATTLGAKTIFGQTGNYDWRRRVQPLPRATRCIPRTSS